MTDQNKEYDQDSKQAQIAPNRPAKGPLGPKATPQSLPHSNDAEMGILGGILLDPREFNRIYSAGITEESFYHPAHSLIYGAIRNMMDTGKAVDFITLTQHLKDTGNLEKAGGAHYVTTLFAYIPTAANIDHYRGILREKEMLRKIIVAAEKLKRMAYEKPTDRVIEEAQKTLLEIVTKEVGEHRTKTMEEHVLDVMADYEAASEKGGFLGLKTGIDQLDSAIVGISPGDYIVIGAETSGGKSALLGNILDNVTIDQDERAVAFTMEMSGKEYTERLWTSRARVNSRTMRAGMGNDQDFTKLTSTASAIANAKLIIEDGADLTIGSLRAKCRALKATYPDLALIGIDYLQLVQGESSKKSQIREQELAEMSRGIKQMAKELHIAVIVLVQLNEDGKIRESRAIGHDANCFILIKTPDISKPDEKILFIAKMRNGERDVSVPVRFIKQYTRFTAR